MVNRVKWRLVEERCLVEEYEKVHVYRAKQADVVLRHTGLGRCPIVSWDFAGAVSIFGPDALPVVHQ